MVPPRSVITRPSAVARRRPAIVTVPSAAQVRLARREVTTLVDAALTQLEAVRDGDYLQVYGAHIDLGRAVRLVCQFRLDDELVKKMAEPGR